MVKNIKSKWSKNIAKGVLSITFEYIEKVISVVDDNNNNHKLRPPYRVSMVRDNLNGIANHINIVKKRRKKKSSFYAFNREQKISK